MKRFEQIINNYLVEQEEQQQPKVNVEELFAQISQAVNTSPNINPNDKQRFIQEIERVATEVHRSLEAGGTNITSTNNPSQVQQGVPQGLKPAGPETMA